MTRKHYIKIAELLKGHNPENPLSYLTYELMEFFKEDNPNFDRMKFYKASLKATDSFRTFSVGPKTK